MRQILLFILNRISSWGRMRTLGAVHKVHHPFLDPPPPPCHHVIFWILNPSCALMKARVGSKIRFDQPTHPPSSWIYFFNVVRCPHPRLKSDQITSIVMCSVPPPFCFSSILKFCAVSPPQFEHLTRCPKLECGVSPPPYSQNLINSFVSLPKLKLLKIHPIP